MRSWGIQVHHWSMTTILRAVVKKLKERKSNEIRLRSMDWLLEHLREMRAQIAAGHWPPKIEDED